MKKIIPQLILFVTLSLQSFASPNNLACVNDAAVVAQVESFTESGFLNCNFQCYLDLNYVDFKEQAIIYFQVGTSENPLAFKNVQLSTDYLESLEVEKVFFSKNYKLKIDFGKIKVRSGFTARLLIIQNGVNYSIHLEPTSFENEITKMNDNDDTEVCKADQFLKKIDFKNLYTNLSAL